MNAILETRRLGASDLTITPVGFGAWAIGGADWKFGWGDQDDAKSIAAIKRAIDLGVNWVDTAAAYGLGHSEEVVARALADVAPSERPYVFTKCALVADGKGGMTESLDPASLRSECEASLRRLRVETIDLYQVHWPTEMPPISTPAGRRSRICNARAKSGGSARRIFRSKSWSGLAKSRPSHRFNHRITRSGATSKRSSYRIANSTASASSRTHLWPPAY